MTLPYSFPTLANAEFLGNRRKRLYIGAYGFEKRSLGWVDHQHSRHNTLTSAIVFHYQPPKGKNLVSQLRNKIEKLGVSRPQIVKHNPAFPHPTENALGRVLATVLPNVDEVIVDITAMTKLLILITLFKLQDCDKRVRIIYSEAEDYAPSEKEYESSKSEMEFFAKRPSRGFEAIIRAQCLSSIRMQGQPLSLIAFTSFNEQLVRHMLGSIIPHHLFFINGRPPRPDFAWRERATQEIHAPIIGEYPSDNPIEATTGKLIRAAGTMDFKETFVKIDEIYRQYGLYERIICAATGSKMQTVGLFFAKVAHPDIHIEYPTPDSYFVKGLSKGIRAVHEVVFENFRAFAQILKAARVSSPV